MARRRSAAEQKVGRTAARKAAKKPIEQYDHRDKGRVNNPPVGLVTPETDPPTNARKQYQYDPHLDPQLVWAGKASGRASRSHRQPPRPRAHRPTHDHGGRAREERQQARRSTAPVRPANTA